MARTRIGLDIGSTAARAAEIAGPLEAPVLVRAAQVPVAPGAVENGEVRNPESVAETLRELWRRGGFKSRQVIMGVGNQRVVVREVALPWLPEKELRDSLPYQVQEFIPISVEDAVLDYDPLDEFETDGRRMLRVLLVAAQRAMVNALVQTAEAAKLEPVGIDLLPFALVRAVGTTEGGMELEVPGDEAVIDVGADVTNICVHDHGVPRFVRILPSGGSDITLAVARALGTSDEDAERLKRGETIAGGPAPDDVRRIALGRAASFVDEIRSSLEFYAAQSPGARVGRVLVTGGGSKLPGFTDLLRERLPSGVERGHVFGKVRADLNMPEEALAEAEPLLPAAVGLGIPGRVGKAA
jgi:type IV pilus assembly protein PilM